MADRIRSFRDLEAAETQTWLDFALACQYCDEETYTELDREYEIILSKLNTMDMKAETFCFAADR